MKQKYYHYEKWEDFQNGMYNEDKENRQERVELAVKLLQNTKLLYEQMKRVIEERKIATEQNLTNNSINHQAFLGQTACAIWKGIHEDETREAWGMLTNYQRYEANKVADRVYNEWLIDYQKNDNNYQLSIFE